MLSTSKLQLLTVLTSLGLLISACDTIKTVYPDMDTDIIKSKKLIASNSINANKQQQNDISFLSKSKAQINWSTLNDNEKVNEIKGIVEIYGGELQGLAYSTAGVVAVVDVYFMHNEIVEGRRLQLEQVLSKLTSTPLQVNIRNNRTVSEMGVLPLPMPIIKPVNIISVDPIRTAPKFAINWAKIDVKPSVSINNTPKPTRFYGDIPEIARMDGITEAEVYRQQVLQYSINSSGLLDKIKKQLKDRLVDYYWQHTPQFSLVIITRQDVKAETHEYVFQKDKAKGFSLPIIILPIADRSQADMRAIYDNENIKNFRQVIEPYGAKLQSIGYTPDGFKLNVSISYAPHKLTPADFQEMEARLQEMTGVKVEVDKRSITIAPL